MRLLLVRCDKLRQEANRKRSSNGARQVARLTVARLGAAPRAADHRVEAGPARLTQGIECRKNDAHHQGLAVVAVGPTPTMSKYCLKSRGDPPPRAPHKCSVQVRLALSLGLAVAQLQRPMRRLRLSWGPTHATPRHHSRTSPKCTIGASACHGCQGRHGLRWARPSSARPRSLRGCAVCPDSGTPAALEPQCCRPDGRAPRHATPTAWYAAAQPEGRASKGFGQPSCAVCLMRLTSEPSSFANRPR